MHRAPTVTEFLKFEEIPKTMHSPLPLLTHFFPLSLSIPALILLDCYKRPYLAILSSRWEYLVGTSYWFTSTLRWGIGSAQRFSRVHPCSSPMFIHVLNIAAQGTRSDFRRNIKVSRWYRCKEAYRLEIPFEDGAPKMDSKTNSMIPDGTVSRSIEIGLRVIGVWPDSSCMFLRRAFWMITLTMAQTFQYRYFVIHVRTDDLSHLMDGLSTTMSYSLLLLKLTILWINRR